MVAKHWKRECLWKRQVAIWDYEKFELYEASLATWQAFSVAAQCIILTPHKPKPSQR